MPIQEGRGHPYIPNAVPAVKAEMLAAIGARSIAELYGDIPESLRYRGTMKIPEAIDSELLLRRHVEGILAANTSCDEATSFLGGGCYNHYVPVICDEIGRRSEFITAYTGRAYEDFGRYQVIWEYQSLMAELLDMDICNVPTYDGFQASCTSLRMAGRYTGRKQVVVPCNISPDRLKAIRNYCEPVLAVETLKADPRSGRMDLTHLQAVLGPATAAVYFENPAYLGFLESQGARIAEMAHDAGALVVVGADPSSLGVLTPPSGYGADLVCGDIQALGNHMSLGGGMGGFIASRDEEKLVMEYPSRLYGITGTVEAGERAFGEVAFERTSLARREHGKEFVGTGAASHAIAACVYLALMGPGGMRDLGLHLLQKAQYLAQRLSALPGVRAPGLKGPFFKEFVVDFNATGLAVAEINQALLRERIFGGKDLSADFPRLGQSALYCVTELVSQEEIDRFIKVLAGILGGK
jgi:glycine dehydrogenase subunit 1